MYLAQVIGVGNKGLADSRWLGPGRLSNFQRKYYQLELSVIFLLLVFLYETLTFPRFLLPLLGLSKCSIQHFALTRA